MYSETVTFTNYDEETETVKLWFHLNKQDILDHPELQDEVEILRAMFVALQKGERTTLSELEIRSLLDFVKKLARLSYGVRSEDGKNFRKRGEWDKFEETAAYDQFLTGLFTPDPVKSLEFLLNVMPKDLMRQAEEQLRKDDPEGAAELSQLRGQLSGEPGIAELAQVVGSGPDKPLATKPYSEMTREELERALADARK